MLSCVFWNSTQGIQHQISCVSVDRDRLFTGSSTGEICIWNDNRPGVLTGCTGGKSCLFLGTVKSPNEFLLTCKGLLVSVHQDFKIRTWDFEDGRCMNSEKLVNFGKLQGLECSDNRLVAVVYETSFVIYDSWVLQKLQILRSGSEIVKVQFFTGKKIVLLNQENELIFWQYSGTLIDPEPYFQLKLSQSYKNFQLDRTNTLISLQTDSGIEVQKVENLKFKLLNPISIKQKNIKDFQFFQHNFIVATETKVFIYDSGELIEKINLGCLEVLSATQEFQIDFIDFKLMADKLVSVTSKGLVMVNLLSIPNTLTEYSFEIPENSFTFLDPQEHLTYSHIIPETWQMLIGTSQGKVLLTSLTSTTPTFLHQFESSPVFCIRLINQYILSSSQQGELFIYNSKRPSIHLNLLSPAKDFFPITLIQDSTELNQFWKSTWKNWEESILVHSEDNSISIVSFVTNSVTCTFLSNVKCISEVAIHNRLEYLFVKSWEIVFIFNISTQSFERTLTGFAANDIMRKVVSVSAQMDFQSCEDLTCDEHKVVEINWRNMGKAGKGGQDLRVQEWVNPVVGLVEGGGQEMGGRVASLLTCWDEGCSAHGSIVNSVEGVEKVPYQYCFGLVGDGWFSFYLPHNKQYSKLIDSIRASTLFKLTKCACTNFRLALGVLSYKSLSNKFCQRIIRDFTLTLSPKSKEKVISICKQILHLRTPSSKVVQKSLSILGSLKSSLIDSEWTRSRISLAETQVALILPYFYMDINKETMLMLATSIFALLRSANEKLYSAGKVLNHTLSGWKSVVSIQLKSVIKELNLLAAGNPGLAEGYFSVIGTFALCDLKVYIGLVNEEIDKGDNAVKKAWLGGLEWMVCYKYAQLAYYAQNVVDVILKILSPHNAIVRKMWLEQCCEILHMLVKKLPMVDFSQTKQKIAIGTSENTIVIYDLKTSSFWKCLEGHTGPLSAIMFSPSGNSIVSYSSHDLTVRLWKIEVRFYQELFTSKSITPSSILSLNKVKSGLNCYKDFIEGVKFSQKSSHLKLTREDLKEYEISISLI